MINLVVTGSREDLTSYQMMVVRNMLDRIITTGHVNTIAIGDCPTGVDLFATQWAEKAGFKPKIFKANWDRYGKAAGPKRNQQMIDWAKAQPLPSFCIGFPGKKSKGTYDCLRRAREAGFEVLVVSIN